MDENRTLNFKFRTTRTQNFKNNTLSGETPFMAVFFANREVLLDLVPVPFSFPGVAEQTRDTLLGL